MVALRIFKQELFAQGIAEGKTAVQAYADAGYSRKRTSAARLLTTAHVKARVDELKASAAKRVTLSRADILQMVIDDRELARQEKQAAAALKADELLGKEIHRMFVERKEIGLPGDFDRLASSEEVLAAMKKEFGEQLAAALLEVLDRSHDDGKVIDVTPTRAIEHASPPTEATDDAPDVPKA